MSEFKNNQIVKEEGDLEWKTPNFAKNFFEFIMGKPQIKPYKSNINLIK